MTDGKDQEVENAGGEEERDSLDQASRVEVWPVEVKVRKINHGK